MGIPILSFWNSFQNLSNVWRTGFGSPSRFNDYLNQASTEIFTEKRLAAIANDKIDDDLSPFLKSENLPVTTPVGANYGLVTRPISEYTYFFSMRAFFSGKEGELVSCGCPTSDNSACNAQTNLLQLPTPIELLPIIKEVRVTKVGGSQWDSILNHKLKYPTIDRPYATSFSQGWKVAPRNLNIITLDNFRLPVPAVFGYTQLPSGYFQYDPLTSVDIEWGNQVYDELLDRVMKLFSVQVKSQFLFQASDNLKQTRV